MKIINVLHIGHSPKWRGGENQVRLLIERMNKLDLGVQHYLAFPKDAVIFKRLEGQVVECLSLPSDAPIDPRSIWLLVRFCKKNKIDVLHSHSGNAHTLAFYVKKLLPALKLVVHRRVDNKIKTKRSTKRKFLSDDVDHFIVVSNAINSMMLDYGVSKKRISMIADAVDEGPYDILNKLETKQSICERFSWSEEAPLIGFISALENQKNPQLFIEILNQLKKKNVVFNAVVAGSGKQEKAVKLLIEQYDLSANVKMLGFVKEVSPLFSALDIFILPSRNEGLGTVLLEAAFAKAVLIASNVGGIGEVVIDQKTGCLIDNTSSSERFAQATKKVIGNNEFKAKLVKNAHEYVNEMFSLTKMAKETASVYKNED